MNIYQMLALEMPRGMVGVPHRWEDGSYLLPREARDRGMMLLDVTYDLPSFADADPLMIFSRDGRLLHAWPDDYFPGPAEIRRVANELANNMSSKEQA